MALVQEFTTQFSAGLSRPASSGSRAGRLAVEVTAIELKYNGRENFANGANDVVGCIHRICSAAWLGHSIRSGSLANEKSTAKLDPASRRTYGDAFCSQAMVEASRAGSLKPLNFPFLRHGRFGTLDRCIS